MLDRWGDSDLSSVTSPVILLGMHRSGTSLVARMLGEIGLFLGWRKDINHEAWFFLRLNDWLLHQCGGAWDQPAPIRYLLANPLGRRVVGDYLRFILDAPRTVTFLGPRQYLHYRSIAALDRPWGWKDPRNTFTLPLWLDLFPDARVVHVYRHGVDVAASLKRRQSESMDQSQRRFRRRRWIYAFAPRWGGFAESWRCAELDSALRLWSEYIHEARAHVAELGDRAMEVRYEDLLESPHRELSMLAAFCSLPASKSAVQRVASQVRPSRALAHQHDPMLRDLAERWREQLRPFGY